MTFGVGDASYRRQKTPLGDFVEKMIELMDAFERPAENNLPLRAQREKGLCALCGDFLTLVGRFPR